MTFERSERISVEGRVRFATPQAAQDFATALQGQNGTVFDCVDGIPQYPNTWGTGQVAPIRIAGRSVYLTWSGLGGSNDHEHTYMVLTQWIDGAEHGCYIVSGDNADNVWCLPETLDDDHLTYLVSAVWGGVSEIEFLRGRTTEADIEPLCALWPQLDTWSSKNSLLTLLSDFTASHGAEGQIPAPIATIFRELWTTPEPTIFSPEAANHEQELYDYWWSQGWTLMSDQRPDVLGELTDELTGEERRHRWAVYAAQALAELEAVGS